MAHERKRNQEYPRRLHRKLNPAQLVSLLGFLNGGGPEPPTGWPSTGTHPQPSDASNRSRLRTVLAVVLTSNVRLVDAPDNVLIPAKTAGLSKDSVANVSPIITIDSRLPHRIRRPSSRRDAQRHRDWSTTRTWACRD